jgi:putative DNA primase/helicase
VSSEDLFPDGNDRPSDPPASARGGEDDWKRRLLRDGRGAIKRNHANTIVYLADSPGWPGVLAFDTFANRTTATRCPPSHEGIAGETWPREWRDSDDALALEWLQREQGLDVGLSVVTTAVEAAALRNPINPPRAYLEGLQWDGTPRVGSWLATYLGVKEDAAGYVREVGSCWLRSAVARALRPGCQVDTMLILEGAQGARKSSALAVLGGAWFTDQLPDLGNKDAQQQLQGVWLVELAELGALSKAEVERVKAFVTNRSDRYRASFGRRSRNYPRTCVFAGTTNATTYLKDESGGRRFWPVIVGAIDLDALERDRDQLWAEAVAQYLEGKVWWFEDAEITKQAQAEQEGRFQADVWEDKLGAYLADKSWTTMGDALAYALGVETPKQGYVEQRRAAQCMARLGWEQRQVRELGTSRRVRRYYPKDAPQCVTPSDDEEAKG